MNNVSINDLEFTNSNAYQEFINNNKGRGYLKIRAYAANQAIPIQGIKILVNKKIDGYNVNFFEGYTNESGIIENINLPTQKQSDNDLIAPKSTSYEIIATYDVDNTTATFIVNVYDNLYVIQNISIVPSMNNGGN